MKPTVSFYPVLAFTRENEKAMMELFENQTGEIAESVYYEHTGVWGFIGRNASMLFSEFSK